MIILEVANVGSGSKESQPLARDFGTKNATESHMTRKGMGSRARLTDRSPFRYRTKRSMHEEFMSQ